MKIYVHPWSVNSRKILMTLAEKRHGAQQVLVMLPKGEHRSPEHLARHPFGKVPVLDHDGFVLYETRAIAAYLDRELPGASLTPSASRDVARMDQWINVADAYFVPHARPVIVELLFRRYLGGERDDAAVAAGRKGMLPALDVLDRALGASPYLAGEALSLADIHWLPYVEYLVRIGEAAPIRERANLSAWFERVAARPTWQRVARTGPQPYEPAPDVAAIERLYAR
jgi:glutathione S-transferase